MTGAAPERRLPLAKVRVVEFCSTAAGPFSAMLLADMGAEVVKIEPPAGDTLRQWPPLNGGYSENFAALNRNKKSVVLDLKSAPDAELARQLILDADIVMDEGFITSWTNQWKKLIPQQMMQSFGPETFQWLAEHPDWDPRVRMAEPTERQDVLRELATWPRPNSRRQAFL